MMVSIQFLATGPAAAANSTTNPYLERGINQVRSLQEESALRTLEQARRWPGNSPEQLAQAHLWLGLAFAGLGQSTPAKASFGAALLLDPGMLLPPGCSPRVVTWWTQAGGKPALPTPVPASPAPLPPAEPLKLAPSPEGLTSPSSPVVSSPPTGEIQEQPRAHPKWARVLGWSLGAAGLAAAAGSIVFAVRMHQQSDQAAQEPRLAPAVALGAEARRSAQTANLLFAVGGGVACIGGGLVLWSW